MSPAPNWTSDNITEVVMLGRWSNSRQCVNVLHVRREEDNPRQSAIDVMNNWQDEMMDAMSNNYSIEGARYRDRNSADGVVGFIPPTAGKPVNGADIVASLPPNCCRLIHKNSELHVGQRPGRIYLVGIAETIVSEDGVIDPANVTAVNVILQNFLNGVSGPSDNELVTVHFAEPSSAVGTVSVVTTLTCDNRVATQRRRLRG